MFPASLYPIAIFPGPPFPGTGKGGVASSLPYDLAAAIVALYEATPSLSGEGAFTDLYRDQAGDNRVMPCLVYTVKRGSLLRKTDVSTWHDDRVTFRAWAVSGAAANQMADAIRNVIEPDGQGLNLHFQAGSTAPLYETDRGQGKALKRGPTSAWEYYAEVEYSARVLAGRAS